jgi:hypothetical protein
MGKVVPQFESELVIQEYTRDRWFLREPLIYTTLYLGFPWRIVVPATTANGGFSTDLASIPHILRPVIRRAGTHRAAVLHDWLCTRNGHFHKRGRDGINRRVADKIFYEALIASGVPQPKAWVMYHGVRMYSLVTTR